MRDKVVVLFFFATFALPAKKALPALAEMEARIGSKKVSVIGVSVDEPEEAKNVAEFIAGVAPRLAVIHDKDRSIATGYQPAKLPNAYVIDKKGVVRLVVEGFANGDDKTIEAKVVELSR